MITQLSQFSRHIFLSIPNFLTRKTKPIINLKSDAMKKNSVWEVILRIFIAAATAALTALGTTSCMGLGPITM